MNRPLDPDSKTRVVAVKLPDPVIAEVKAEAARRGIGWTTLLRELIVRGLQGAKRRGVR